MPLRGATSASHAASSACRWSGETAKYEAFVTSDSQSVSNICIGSRCVVLPVAGAFHVHFTATMPDIVTRALRKVYPAPATALLRPAGHKLSYSLVSVADGVLLFCTDGHWAGVENMLCVPKL